MQSLEIDQQVRRKNRKKLINQNYKLYMELKHLQTQIDKLEESQQEQIVQQNVNFDVIKQQIQIQKKQIKHLKEQVTNGRSGNLKQNVIYIRKEEDELLSLKKQLEAFQNQKELLSLTYQSKQKTLATYEPLRKHKENIQAQWAETKKQNRENSMKIVQLEREVRKFHEMKKRIGEIDNTPSDTRQIHRIQEQIVRMESEIKQKEIRWRPNLQILDNEFFSSKNTLNIIFKKIQELEKEEGIWKTRAAALRDQTQIEIDRDRLSKVIAMQKTQIIKVQTPISKIFRNSQLPIQQAKITKKNDKPLELIRIESQPKPVTINKQNQIRNSSKDIPKQLIMNKINKIDSAPASPLNKKNKQINIGQQSKTKINKNVHINQLSKLLNKNITSNQKPELNKKQSNWSERRQKQKIKNSIAFDLAQKIKQKAEQVKKMNAKMEIDTPKQINKNSHIQGKTKKSIERERSVSSPKKKSQSVLIKSERVQTAIISEKSNVSQQTKQKNKDGINIIKKKEKSISEIKLNEAKPQITEIKLIKNSKQLNKSKVQKSQKNTQKKLVQNINIISSNKDQTKKIKQQINKIKQHSVNQNLPIQVSDRKISQKPRLQDKVQQIKIIKPSPKFQIYMSDLQPNPIKKQTSSLINKPQAEEIDQMEGVPRRVIKKKVNAGNQANNFGTST